ncbi:hypothetical protein [Paenisporosarcina sp. TG-14]|uniref:hypothetical protein n=1 Tax=Paenisporosarcina sp. TG-14 TaxID=1231057 RepID=UPI000363DB5A|nr:hypothetical protein [Paenisporosarcina sp. TG-14]
MDDSIGYVMVVFVIIGTTYGLVRQIQHIMTIQRLRKTDLSNYKRTLIGYYLESVSLLGFLISFTLNVLVGIQIIQSNLVTSDKTVLSCFIFLGIFLITKLIVIPKNSKQHKLLKG